MHRPAADADVFRAIADPTRRAILGRLRDGPAPVNALAAAFAQSRPTTSKHLQIVVTPGSVTYRRAGRQRIFRIEPGALRQVDDWIGGYRSLWQDNLNRLKRYLEEE
jgi:DNA-binding transcriptional ArsR family regulator